MMVKYRVHEVAKDFNVSSREVIDFIKETTGAEKKHMTALNEDELNLVFEHFSKDKQVANFEEYLAGKLDVKAAEEKSGTKTKQSKEKATTSGKDKKATSDSESKAKKDETKRGNSKKISAADSSKKEGNKKVSNTSKEKSVKYLSSKSPQSSYSYPGLYPITALISERVIFAHNPGYTSVFPNATTLFTLILSPGLFILQLA